RPRVDGDRMLDPLEASAGGSGPDLGKGADDPDLRGEAPLVQVMGAAGAVPTVVTRGRHHCDTRGRRGEATGRLFGDRATRVLHQVVERDAERHRVLLGDRHLLGGERSGGGGPHRGAYGAGVPSAGASGTENRFIEEGSRLRRARNWAWVRL